MSRDLVGLPRRKMWPTTNFFGQLHYLFRWQDIKDWPEEERNAVTDPAIHHLRYLLGLDEWYEYRLQMVENTSERTEIGATLVALVGTTTLMIAAYTWWRARRRGEVVGAQATGPRAAFLLLGGILCVYHFMHYDLLVSSLPAVVLLVEIGRLRWPGRLWLLFCLLGMFGCTFSMAYFNGVLRAPYETFLLIALWITTGWWAILDERSRQRKTEGTRQATEPAVLPSLDSDPTKASAQVESPAGS
jgi:hypothetical protein